MTAPEPGAVEKALEEDAELLRMLDFGKTRNAQGVMIPTAALDRLVARLAEKDAEIKALREMAKTEKDYADAEERYFALPFDDRTKAEQGKLLAAYDARAAARAQVQP